MITITQGDSSDLIVLKEKNLTNLADDNWVARLVVIKNEKSINNPLIKKNFGKNTSNDSFIVLLEPDETSILDPGEYILGMEVENLSLKFRRELKEQLRIVQQVVK